MEKLKMIPILNENCANPVTVIETERLILRTWQDKDANAFYRINNQPKVTEFLLGPMIKDSVKKFMLDMNQQFKETGYTLWATVEKSTNKLIGFIGLNTPKWEADFTPCVEIGWRLGAEFWGKGYATEGAQAVLDYGFTQCHLKEIVSFTIPENIRSIRVMEKIGMHYVGNFMHPKVPTEHAFCKHVLYKIDAPATHLLTPEGFFKAKTASQIQALLENISPNAIILFDIDDTIITPVSKTFRKDPYNKIIDHIKKDKQFYENYEFIISNFRLQRKSMLINKEWPGIINQLKHTHPVFGLTKMDTGKFGNIASMESWRYNELKSHNIEFTDNEKMDLHAKSITGFQNPPSFIKGIFMTGSASKQETLDQFHSLFNADQVVLIDDRAEHLLDIKNYCQKHNMAFLGILFTGLEQLPGTQNPKVAKLQKEYLIKQAKWLEDGAAEEILAKGEEK